VPKDSKDCNDTKPASCGLFIGRPIRLINKGMYILLPLEEGQGALREGSKQSPANTVIVTPAQAGGQRL
jgi:hypothetical protein